jgi:hypothetical protein
VTLAGEISLLRRACRYVISVRSFRPQVTLLSLLHQLQRVLQENNTKTCKLDIYGLLLTISATSYLYGYERTQYLRAGRKYDILLRLLSPAIVHFAFKTETKSPTKTLT